MHPTPSDTFVCSFQLLWIVLETLARVLETAACALRVKSRGILSNDFAEYQDYEQVFLVFSLINLRNCRSERNAHAFYATTASVTRTERVRRWLKR